MIDIDLVYLWVNGNDPVWMAKRDACIGRATSTEGNCKGRYADNDELKYSLRSVEKYAPWIRRIFIVTDNQVPEWLDLSNPKIQIVDHTEILPPESLPCFNSRIIEHHLHKIPGLAEHFLFANDDMLINKAVTPATFFADDGLPIIMLIRKRFGKFSVWYKKYVLRKRLTTRVQAKHNAALLVEKKYGKYYDYKAHHNIDAYLKSTYQYTRELFSKEIDKTLCNHTRSADDIQRVLYTYVALAENRGHIECVPNNVSFRLAIHKAKLYEDFQKFDPILFCVNDSQFATDEDRQRSTAFLDKLFPDKSSYEK